MNLHIIFIKIIYPPPTTTLAHSPSPPLLPYFRAASYSWEFICRLWSGIISNVSGIVLWQIILSFGGVWGLLLVTQGNSTPRDILSPAWNMTHRTIWSVYWLDLSDEVWWAWYFWWRWLWTFWQWLWNQHRPWWIPLALWTKIRKLSCKP